MNLKTSCCILIIFLHLCCAGVKIKTLKSDESSSSDTSESKEGSFDVSLSKETSFENSGLSKSEEISIDVLDSRELKERSIDASELKERSVESSGTSESESEGTNSGKEDIANRMYLASIPRYDCYTRLRDPGRCVPLHECEFLRQRVENMNRLYVLQAVADYTCGFQQSIQVCCPASSQLSMPDANALAFWPTQPRPDRPRQPSGSWMDVNEWARPTRGSTDLWGNEDTRTTWGRPNQSGNRQTTTERNGWSLPSIGSWFKPSNDRTTTERDPWSRPTSIWGGSSNERTTERDSWNRPSSSSIWGGSSNERTTERDSWNRPSSSSIWGGSSNERTTERDSWNRPSSIWGGFSNERTTERDPWGRPSSSSWETSSERTTTELDILGSNRRPTARPEEVPSPDEGRSDSTSNHRNRRLLSDSCGADSMANKVLFGNDTALGEYPWVALLRMRLGNGVTYFSCGGSLINARYVLTAAHCIRVPKLKNARVDMVRLGEHDTRTSNDCQGQGETRICSEPPQDIKVERAITHPGYRPDDATQKDDIALLRLDRPVNLNSYVQPICLPLDKISRNNYDSQSLWVAGWGRTTNDPESTASVKQKVALPVVPFSKCAPIYKQSKYRLTLRTTQMCAGGGKEDSCQGDSGGPLMSLDQVGFTFKWHVQGIVSIGPDQCGTIGQPGIYTKVRDYLPWILDTIQD